METIIIGVVKQIFDVAGVIVASGIITTLITQALKWQAIKIPASKYPVPVAAVLSVLTSLAAVFMLDLVVITSWLSWLVVAGATLLTATQVYDLIHNAIKKKQDVEAGR
jgi:fatty acid desaturase